MNALKFSKRLLLTFFMFVALLLFSSKNLFAQTTLSTGDISIIGFNANAPDGFAFVNWVDLAPGTEIKFTDNGFNSTANSNTAGNYREQEQYVVWRNNTGAIINAGTVITIQANSASSPSGMITNFGEVVSVTNSSNATVTSTISLVNTSGDQIFAFQGAGGPSSNGVTFSGTLLFGLGYSGSSGLSTGWVNTGTINGSTSYLPSDLSGASQIFLGPNTAAGQYTGADRTNKSSMAEYKASVANSSNWTLEGPAGTVTLNTAPFTVSSPTAITAQPINSTICAGANTTFNIIASNASSYQWQVDTGAGYVDVPASAPYSGSTSSTLTITGATAAMNGYSYRCIATGSSAVNSNGATLTISLASSITAGPSVSTICAGANTTFSVSASNATGYQWQVNTGSGFTNITNGGVYSGATVATLTLTGVTGGMNGYLYRVVASGDCTPAATSNSATLIVNLAPAITSQPSASTICAGANTTFSATASNATGYQWQVNYGSGFVNITNGGVYSNATTATLIINGAVAGMNGYQYRVVVTGNCTPATTSSNATLTIDSAPFITSQPLASTICAGANTTFSVTASNATGYQWQVDQGAGFSNVPASAPYSGTTTATLVITGAMAGLNGYIYRVVATGVCTPNATSNGAALTVNSAPFITSQPSASTICVGSNTTFSATASNATGYQWQVDQGAGFSNVPASAPYSGTTSATLTITGASAALSGYLYRVIVTGTCTPAATSNAAALTVNSAPAITSQPSASTICAGANTTFTVAASNATGYQWQVDQGAGFSNVPASAPYSGTTSATLTITGATVGLNGYVYRVVATGSCTPNAVSIAAALTINSAPAITSQPSASTICAGANTTFTVAASNATGYQWQFNYGIGFINISNVGIISGANTATLTITGATAEINGYQYRVVVTGSCTPSTTSNAVALTVNSAPAITAQPSARTICAGANTTFTAVASNATGYQWQVNTGSGFTNITDGGVYTGASAATLTLTGATAGMNGYIYRVVVTGTCTPAATSNAAALTINSAPAITSQPSASTICAGANTTFTVAASNATGYQWQVNQGAGFSNISNGAPYSGATSATLTITGASAGLSGYVYRVVVTGTCTPAATSNAAALTINSAPAITSQPTDRLIIVGSNTTFNATASNATGYQWQVDQGAGFSNVPALAPYSGTTTATLTITGATAGLNGYIYRVVATGACTPNATSNSAKLSLPIITISGTPIALSTTYGTASMASSFSVSAVNLTNEITLTAPSGFELSTNSASGYANTILVGTAGDLSATTIYVRLRAGARPVSSPYSGNITLSTPGGTTVTVATASSTVAVKPITAVLNNTSPITKIYNGTDDATLVASNYGLNGLEVCDEVTVSGTASYSNKDFGIGKTVTAGNLVLAGIDAANYTLSNNTATTTGDITKRTVNVTAVANTKVYGSPDPELGYTFGPALLTGEIFNGSLSRLAGEDVGDYDITMGSLAISNNYTIVLTTAKLSITPGALIVRADLKTKTYGDSDPSLTYTVIGASGTGNVFTGSLARTAGENVGSYSITQGTLALDGNHQMRFESSELTIAPRPLLIKADNQSKYVGAANPALTFSYSGFKAGETNSVLSKQPEISTTATTASLAGSYDIIVGGAVAQNYAIIYQQGILMINDINSAPTLGAIANQLVCAGVGEQQVALSGISAGRETNQTVSLSVSSNNSSLFTSLAVSRGAGATGTLNYRPAAGATGTATVTVTVRDNGGTDVGGVDTYTRSFTITISPLPVVTISSDKGLTVAKGETVNLTATGGTSYQWSNASGVVSGQNTAVLSVRPTANTTYTVTARNASGCSSTQSITIQVTEEAVAAKPTNIMSPNGDGVNDKWVIENLDLYPNNEVIVVDRSGRTIYSKKGYDNSWDATLRGLPLSEGTYYYIINYGDGKTPAKKGFITILNKR